jgi:hypothetical protein
MHYERVPDEPVILLLVHHQGRVNNMNVPFVEHGGKVTFLEGAFKCYFPTMFHERYVHIIYTPLMMY